MLLRSCPAVDINQDGPNALARALARALPDNAGGGSAMVECSSTWVTKRSGVVAGPPALTTVDDRLRGFREALSAAGVDLSASAVVHADLTRDGGREATARLLDARQDMTASFAMNDAMAVGALAELHHRRIPVPDRMSLAGFDDIPFASDVKLYCFTVSSSDGDLLPWSRCLVGRR